MIKQTNKIVLALNRGESMNKMFEMLRVEQERVKARAYKTGDTRQFIGKFSNPECLQGLVTAKDLNLYTATAIFTFITSNQGCLAITEEGRR